MLDIFVEPIKSKLTTEDGSLFLLVSVESSGYFKRT
jgi:hypothetical protein